MTTFFRHYRQRGPVDALQMRFEPIEVKRNPECPVCSERPSITELIDYDLACEIPPSATSPSSR